jgi:hypothetical protein
MPTTVVALTVVIDLTVAGGLTVTLQVACLPFVDLEVIVHVPVLTAVTLPLLTVAISLFDEDHVTDLVVALDGLTVALSVYVLLMVSAMDVFDKLIDLTAIVLANAVIGHKILMHIIAASRNDRNAFLFIVIVTLLKFHYISCNFMMQHILAICILFSEPSNFPSYKAIIFLFLSCISDFQLFK